MSEKQQHTATGLRDKMLNRYGDDYPHKHNKYHLSYRHHCRSHPVERNGIQQNGEINASTGLQKEFKLRKIRKRLDKGRFH